MASEPNRRLTIPDYLALEREAETRSDYLDGEMFAMTGASREQVGVEHFLRQGPDRWLLTETADPGTVLDLPSIGCRLALVDVYEDVLGR